MKALPDDTSLNLLYGGGLGDHGMPGVGAEAMREFLKKHPAGNLECAARLALLLVGTKKIRGKPRKFSIPSRKPAQYSCRLLPCQRLLSAWTNTEAIPYLHAKAVKRAYPTLWRPWPKLAFLYEQEGDWKRGARNLQLQEKTAFFTAGSLAQAGQYFPAHETAGKNPAIYQAEDQTRCLSSLRRPICCSTRIITCRPREF